MHKEPIAIIGIGCRLPGARNPQEFWQLLCNGVDAITEVPETRWDLDEYYDPDPTVPHKMSTRWGGFLSDIDQFDPAFFGIAPREVKSMDPQQRLLVETAWEALEDGGQIPKQLSGSKTGVFMGISSHDYSSLVKTDDPYSLTGNTGCIAANRLSYLFNFRGPSFAIDTACSSSLVAIHLACQSLQSGECQLALAGGVQAILAAKLTVNFSKAGLLSPDGRCKSFDARANGYVRSEGAGIAVLKPLSQAQADGDPIYAVILGSAVNQDGRSNGLSAPNPEAQEAVLREAYRSAGVSPGQVQYVEAHGTGTKLGDPMELKALGAVLSEGRAPGKLCAVGSVKTNIGHAETAAGITGLIKVALSLKHQQIPPSLHFSEPNPYINFDALPIRIQQTLEPWPMDEGSALAGVSSFGFGGTNAHVVLQESSKRPHKPSVPVQRKFHLLTLSAKSKQALQDLGKKYQEFLEQHPMVSLGDLCYTANTRRSHFNHRLTLVGQSNAEIQHQLAAFVDQGEASGVAVGETVARKAPLIAFLATGQGAQYAGMGRELYDTHPLFRSILDECDRLLRPYLQPSLLDAMFGVAGGLLDDTLYTQPALFALEYALAQLWISWGIRPSVVMGHSVGEYVAACLAGVFSLEDGLRLIATRGRLMQALPQDGAMVSVMANEAKVMAALQPYGSAVAIAAMNGPEHFVVSGKQDIVSQLIADLGADGIKTKPLNVSHAFHSSLMEPMLAEFAQVASEITYARPKINLISNLTGSLIGSEIATPEYWCLHAREPVRFAASMQTLQQRGNQIFLEIGPKPILLGMGRACVTSSNVLWLPSLRPAQSNWQQMLTSLSALYLSGVEINWAGFEQDTTQRQPLQELPTYPFQRQSYWWTPEELAQGRQRSTDLNSTPLHPLLGKRLHSTDETVNFEAQISAQSPTYLQEHCILGQPVFPATAYLELAAAAAVNLCAGPSQIESVVIEQPLLLEASRQTTIQIQLTPQSPTGYSFEIFSLKTAGASQPVTVRHATGQIAEQSSLASEPSALQEIQSACPQAVSTADFYEQLYDRGLEYGTAFRSIRQLWRGESQALGQVQLQATEAAQAKTYQIHPALLDACLQVLGAALDEDSRDSFLPVGVKQISFYTRSPLTQVWSHAEICRREAGSLWVDFRLYDESGVKVAEIKGLTLRLVGRSLLRQMVRESADLSKWLYEVTWQPQAPAATATMERSPGRWLVFADEKGVGTQLGQQLQERGDSCVWVFPAQAYSHPDSDTYKLNPASPEDFSELLQEMDLDSPLLGVIHLWGLTSAEPIDEADLHAAQILGCGSTLHLVQAMSQLPGTQKPQLWLFTQNAQAIGSQKTVNYQQSVLWGLGNTIALEYPDLNCRRVDLDADLESVDFHALATELCFPSVETQVAYRKERFVPRFSPKTSLESESGLVRPGNLPFQLKISDYGILENLTLQPMTRRGPGSGEVEIQVRAAGLNFRDVLNALGMLKAYLEKMGLTDAADVPFGGECAGTITAVGEGIEGLKVGDAVIAANAVGSMASFVTVSAAFVVPKPDNLSFLEAATLATTFLTAHYGLHHLAQIKAGDRVLIHSATGGVGQAAVQLAQRAGAEVFATASPPKWDLLKAMGIQQPMNSRTVDFASEIMAQTEGRGVDIVLNSLNGDFIPKSLEVLTSGGRFVEIGKLGIWDAQQVEEARPDVQYLPFDLLELSQQQPDQISTMLQKLMPLFESGVLKPLPHQDFAIEEAAAAFRHMAQAKHTGKVVLDLTTKQASIRSDSTYLVTGGLGALGQQVAAWLVEQGAQNLVLLGRKEPSASVQVAIQRLERQNVKVLVLQADVAQAEDLTQAFKVIESTLPPLRGVFHTAGVLSDGILAHQTWERFEQVMAPKVTGSWMLHQLTRALELDHFVCFSSIASVLGSPGQGNYAAANGFMDGLAHHRRSLGLPGLSINWGPWSSSGMAAELSERDTARLSMSGITPISGDLGLQILEQLIKHSGPQVSAIKVDWSKFLQQLPLASPPPFLDIVATANPILSSQSAFLKQLETVPGPEQRTFLSTYIRSQISKVLGLGSPDQVQPDQRLSDLGMDSLMGMDLKSRLQISFNYSFPITLAADYPTVGALINYIANDVLGLEEAEILDSIALPVIADLTDLDAPTQSDSNGSYSSQSISGSDLAGTNGNGSNGNGRRPKDAAAIALEMQLIPPEHYEFQLSPEYLNLQQSLEQGREVGNPFFTLHDGIARDTIRTDGKDLINFASYNYLGLSGDPAVSAAAKAAIDLYGTSVSASRVVSGERPIHQQLERELASFLRTEDCLVYIGGHTTNVSTIGHMFGRADLVVCDAFSHNSIQLGCALSGSKIIQFAHNDVQALEQILRERRAEFEKVLIVVEGIYSADGDIAPLPEVIELKKRYKTFLMVDEAHSIGVLGAHGRGIAEHFDVNPADVDLWMGTLSKSFSSCGGYIAASHAIVEYLKYTSPGFVYSVGMPPSNAAAALESLNILRKQPERVAQLHRRTKMFITLAQEKGIDTGNSHGSPIIPIIVGDPYRALRLSRSLSEHGINAQPMIYPSVPYDAARLRFFLSCTHSEEQIRFTVETLAVEMNSMQKSSSNDWLHYWMRSQFVSDKAVKQDKT